MVMQSNCYCNLCLYGILEMCETYSTMEPENKFEIECAPSLGNIFAILKKLILFGNSK